MTGALFDMRSDAHIDRSAIISDCGRYRYLLTRTWDTEQPPALFIMLNPSTADADHDDATIRRCIKFATDVHFPDVGGIAVVNLYAYRATQPADLWTVDDPVGPDNDVILPAVTLAARFVGAPIFAAWGANARPDRVAAVVRLIGDFGLSCLGTRKTGHPRHPLYLPDLTPLVPWTPPQEDNK